GASLLLGAGVRVEELVHASVPLVRVHRRRTLGPSQPWALSRVLPDGRARWEAGGPPAVQRMFGARGEPHASRWDALPNDCDGIRAQGDGIHVGFDGIQLGDDGIHADFDALHAGFDGIHARVDRIHAGFDGIHARVDGIHAGFDGVHAEVDRIHAGF